MAQIENLNWYDSLQKSNLTPPNYIFSVAWSILYIMIFSSFFIYLFSKNRTNNIGVILFVIQLIFNLSWAPIFFKLKNPKISLFVIIILWGLILSTLSYFHKVSPLASYLLIPYFIWVVFATYLNFFIVVNNK
jgi:tryptophan-rich sensory protein